MITGVFLTIVYGFILVITAPFRITPDVSLPAIITGAISDASRAVMSLDEIFPVHETFFILIGVFVLYEAAYFGMKLVNWIIRKIPGIS